MGGWRKWNTTDPQIMKVKRNCVLSRKRGFGKGSPFVVIVKQGGEAHGPREAIEQGVKKLKFIKG